MSHRRAAFVSILPLLLVACTDGSSDSSKTAASKTGTASDEGSGSTGATRVAPTTAIRFSDITAESGITFRHDNGWDGTSYRVVETVNGGVAFLDFDGDGFLDLYLTSGRKIDVGSNAPKNALYRGRGDGTFEDVSTISGTDDSSFSLGACIADVDGDGRPDIYVTNDGPNRLYRNLGSGKFEDVAKKLGVASDSMDAGAVFFDMDSDGDLDLYVASYVTDERADQKPAISFGTPSYWPPRNYAGSPDRLYENRGGEGFVDVSESSGIRNVTPGRGLGVVAQDLNGDGHSDIYVANDMTLNFLFVGDGKGKFEEVALEAGVAAGFEGRDQGSMGVTVADFDADGLPDLCVTNYFQQLNNLFRSTEAGIFDDIVQASGVARDNSRDVSWGVGFHDFDSDGWRDLFVVNGHLNPYAEKLDDGSTYRQRDRLFRNTGGGVFVDVSSSCGDIASIERVGRGAAFGDIDNDGDIDIVVSNSGDLPVLLRNDSPPTHGWLFVRLVGDKGNRDGVGARVTITVGGETRSSTRTSSDSYLGSNDPRLHFGIGASETVDELRVRWADGSEQSHKSIPANRLVVAKKSSAGFDVQELKPGAPR